MQSLTESFSQLSLPSPPNGGFGQRLPPEVVAIVVEHLDGKNVMADVQSCSLVCREWYPCATPRIFSELAFTVRRQDRDALDEKYNLPRKSSKQGSLSELLTFLDGTPHICPYVRTLRIEAPPESRQQDDYPDIDPRLVAQLLGKLPNIDALDLHDVLYLPSHYDTWRNDPLRFSGTLKRLSVSFGARSADIDSFDDALHLLELFSGNIKQLCLSTLYAVRVRRPDVESLQHLRIGSLVVDEVTDIGPLVRAVSRSPSVWDKTLKAIYLSWINMKDLRSAECVLDEVKGHLVYFGCNLFPLLDSKPADEELFRILDFSEYESLETVTFGVVLLPEASWNANIWRDLCRILTSLPASRAPHLQVNFELSTDRLNYSTHIALEANWRSLDTTLEGRCKRVRFLPARKSFSVPADGSFPSSLQQHIIEMLPGLAEAGVLSF